MRFDRFMSCPLALLVLAASTSVALGGDVTWDNNGGTGDFNWNTSSPNWTGAAWNNANGDGAIFSSTAAGVVGAINVPGAITANSINFSANGYTLNGTGSITLSVPLTPQGGSTLTTGVINAEGGITTINVPINSTTTAFQAVSQIGGGVLALSAPVNVTASEPFAAGGPLTSILGGNVIVGRVGNASAASTLRLLNSSVLPATTNVLMGGGGVLDIGSNNATLGGIVFVNQNSGLNYGSQYGVVGSGTLKVNGDINVIGDLTGNNFGNAITTPLDMGGGTQVIRVAEGSAFAGPASLMMTGVISNGSLLKTIGYNQNGGLVPSGDGLGLFANNTYTGPTIFNGGTNGFGQSMTTGTNLSTSLKVATSILSVQGANGSYGSATNIQILSGGTLILDNNATFGSATSSSTPYVPAAFNSDRIPDTAIVTMRDGAIVYRGLAATASSETYGSMHITGGYNTITVTPNGTGGSATFAATGSLTMDPRTTLQISTASTVLGTSGFVKFGGTVPSTVGVGANAIIQNVVNTTDFLTYDPTNGFTPYPAPSYATSYTAGANVALTAAASVPSTVAINAVKTTGSVTTTISSGQVLTVSSGMMFATSSTHTVNGGTLDFAGTAGVLMGSLTINSAVTGSQGLLASGTGTVTLGGDLSGLTGTISNIGSGTLALSGPAINYAGALENRRGTLSFTASSAGSALTGGPITLGVSANDSNLLPANPGLSISNSNIASFSRDILVDNGGTNAGGVALNRNTLLPTLTVLSNSTATQTISGNITLNTSLVHSASISTTSAFGTNYTGNITGSGTFLVNAGRVNFTNTSTLSNAGGVNVYAAGGGNTAIVNFNGTATGNAPIYICAGSDSRTGISYTTQSNLFTGPITVDASGFTKLPTINVLGTSSISNAVGFVAPRASSIGIGGVNVDVASNFNGTWAGPVTGAGSITKLDTGTLTLTNAGNSYTGNTTISAGTLALSGSGNFASSPTFTVGTAVATPPATLDVNGVTGGANFTSQMGGAFALASGQTLKGFGLVSGKTFAPAGATIAPGGSVGTLNFDNSLELGGTYLADTAATGSQLADDIILSNGNLTIDPIAMLSLPGTNHYDNATPMTIMSVTGGGTLNGTFANVTGLPANYSLQYTSTSLILTPVPEPGTLALLGAAGIGLAWNRRRRLRA
jgi:autotransporter-associated beta strand protein